MVANGGKVGEVCNVGGHNERPNIFIVKTIINQLHDRLQDEGISEASSTLPTVWVTTAATASTPPRSRTIWAGTPKLPLEGHRADHRLGYLNHEE